MRATGIRSLIQPTHQFHLNVSSMLAWNGMEWRLLSSQSKISAMNINRPLPSSSSSLLSCRRLSSAPTPATPAAAISSTTSTTSDPSTPSVTPLTPPRLTLEEEEAVKRKLEEAKMEVERHNLMIFGSRIHPLDEPVLTQRQKLTKWKNDTYETLPKRIAEGKGMLVAGAMGVVAYLGWELVGLADAAEIPDGPYLGYLIGLGGALGIAAVWGIASPMLTVRPGLPYRKLIRNLQGDIRVKQLIGVPVGRPSGTFREFEIYSGGPRWRKEAKRVGDDAYSGWERFWKPQRIRYQFLLQGSQRSALVTADVERFASQWQRHNSVKLYALETGEHITLGKKEAKPAVEASPFIPGSGSR